MQTAKELLTQYQGITSRVQTLFSYHYDQILREIEIELQGLPKNHADILHHAFVLYMEDYINWPIQPREDPTSKRFIQQLTD